MKVSNEWFRDWFNTEHYLRVYSHRDNDEAKKFAELVLSHVSLKNNSKILDYCCGNGRLSNILGGMGYQVEGIDLSPGLIKIAKRNATKLNSGCNFISCDIRHFNETEKYDLVINFFTSFGYFNKNVNEKIFDIMCKGIKKNGYLAFDFFNIDFLKKKLVKYDEKIIKGVKYIQERKITKSRVIKKIKILKNNSFEEYYESVMFYRPDKLNEMLSRNGLKIIHSFGDYDGNKINENSSRIILIARKR